MQIVYVDNRKNVTTNIVSVEDNVATVEFYVDGELALVRPIKIPEQANGDTNDASFTSIIESYARRLRFGAHIGLKQDETVKSM
jgi:hypothetical protein